MDLERHFNAGKALGLTGPALRQYIDEQREHERRKAVNEKNRLSAERDARRKATEQEMATLEAKRKEYELKLFMIDRFEALERERSRQIASRPSAAKRMTDNQEKASEGAWIEKKNVERFSIADNFEVAEEPKQLSEIVNAHSAKEPQGSDVASLNGTTHSTVCGSVETKNSEELKTCPHGTAEFQMEVMYLTMLSNSTATREDVSPGSESSLKPTEVVGEHLSKTKTVAMGMDQISLKQEKTTALDHSGAGHPRCAIYTTSDDGCLGNAEESLGSDTCAWSKGTGPEEASKAPEDAGKTLKDMGSLRRHMKMQTHDILPQVRSSVPENVRTRGREAQHMPTSVQSHQVESSQKDTHHKPRRSYITRPKVRNREAKEKMFDARKRTKFKPRSTSQTPEFPGRIMASRAPCSQVYPARRVYRRGKEWHRSHCRKRDKLSDSFTSRFVTGPCFP